MNTNDADRSQIQYNRHFLPCTLFLLSTVLIYPLMELVPSASITMLVGCSRSKLLDLLFGFRFHLLDVEEEAARDDIDAQCRQREDEKSVLYAYKLSGYQFAVALQSRQL